MNAVHLSFTAEGKNRVVLETPLLPNKRITNPTTKSNVALSTRCFLGNVNQCAQAPKKNILIAFDIL